VDALGVGELTEFLVEECEEALVLLGRAIEVLGRERIKCELLDADLGTPVEDLFGGLRARTMAVGGVLATLVGVPPVAVLNHGDVGGCAVDFAFEQTFVRPIEQATRAGSHYSSDSRG
jgi:hypothetical protein